MRREAVRRVEVCLSTRDFEGDLRFFTEVMGFRLDRIWPADDPAFAALSGHGTAILLERGATPSPVGIRLLVEDPEGFAGGETGFLTPGGHRVTVAAADPPLVVPEARREFVVCRAGSSGGRAGRAGMLYRDLVPGRLGGALIASHIRIPEGGPVSDLVHYHAVAFQLIFCHRGWVRVVYEDQGPPFALGAGDCLIQPPRIRHRVLAACDGAEVVEVSVPAEHLTTMDHEMELPTPRRRPERDFDGTRFALHREAGARWTPWRVPGFEARETGIGTATNGAAGVQVARRIPGIAVPEMRHDADILFVFLRRGAMTLGVEGHPREELGAGDACCLPPQRTVSIEPTDDLEILEVALPALG